MFLLAGLKKHIVSAPTFDFARVLPTQGCINHQLDSAGSAMAGSCHNAAADQHVC